MFLARASGAGAAFCDHARFTVVLDIGHNRESPGAISARGATEFSFNLRLAEIIRQALDKHGFRRLVRSLPGDNSGSLLARALRARAVDADLLLSIHHDSVQPRYLAPWVFNGAAQRYSDRFNGWSIFVSVKNVRALDSALAADILASELLRAKLPFTRHHAQAIAGENRQLLIEDRGVYRYDDLAVLRRSAAPAMLLEAGVIVNRREEERLSSTPEQTKIGEAVARAVDAYCATEKFEAGAP